MMIEQDMEVVSNRRVATQTFLLTLRSPEMVASAEPGQFVMIRVRDAMDPFLRRPFSLCGTLEDDLFLILYRVVGRGTGIMAETVAGERFSVLGPLGKGFVLPTRDNLPLLVAGGIGVAPLFFLAQTMKRREFPFEFMMGFGSAHEIISFDQITGLSMDVSFATDDGTAGHPGPVTDLLETFLVEQGPGNGLFSVFTCGPASMLKRIARMVSDHGLPCQVSLESVMACGLGACQGCALRASLLHGRSFCRVCREGPVFPVQSIDWSSL